MEWIFIVVLAALAAGGVVIYLMKGMSNPEKYIPHAHFSVAFATLLLVIVGIWGVIETRGALESTQRAWISPLGAQLAVALELKQGIHITIAFINSGREPATDVSVKIRNDTIDAFDPQFADLSKIQFPNNVSCDDTSPVKDQAIIAPSSPGIGTGWNVDSLHGEPTMVVTQDIIDGKKFYVFTGCVAYRTYEATHKASFCYVMEYNTSIPSALPPNIVIAPAASPTARTEQPGSAPGQTVSPKPTTMHSYVFATCAHGFSAN
ncbi:MAG: hypothetical protein ACLQJR_01870 [Stellaceae bacterium]